MRGAYVEVGGAQIPALAGVERFKDGQPVKLIFRPEDVLLSKTQAALPAGRACLASGVVEATNFVGAYERVRVRLDPSGGGSCDASDTPYYLTTETPESSDAKPIIATRPKPETMVSKLRRGDRVFLGLNYFTILSLASRSPATARL
jgi:hypothetical protein